MVEVKLHDIGEGMHEGEILHFFVKPGDIVTIDQPLVEVQTDKVTAELPSPVAGKVSKLLVKEGETVTVGTVLLVLEGEGSSHAKKESQEPLGAAKQVTTVGNSPKDESALALLTKRILAAPYTRKLAREHQVDLELVTGTGPAGRITEEDVMRFVAGDQKDNIVSAAALEEPQKDSSLSTATVSTIPFKGRRKQIAKKMTQSLFTIPHVTHFEEIDMTALLEMKKQLKQNDTNVSVAAFFVKALQFALRDFPIFNSKLDEANDVIQMHEQINIGIATDAEDGLIVPVIHDIKALSIKEINEDMKMKMEKAKNGTLSRQDMSNGTFTISNVGPLGSMGATPIINAPEVALMAFHKTKRVPVVMGEEIVIRSMMNVSMSFDHRVADGASAVMFTNRFKHFIENPSFMLVEMV
ncbi:dehydrogenase catalytic domain-containing protein [Fictibacillus macauensis ZFHKF-1]|uniref:Dihydrolipoamide acetyltransferase component of pyruvate dehydrogenase complex n=1 Tax=Fictibacillus macauensis ZFHKF-1 TaxID=1196324 RepID=I8AJT0_9BACL|nr:dihydrolipoamide acetyltransferase family protein [Fictibacillus macauensis]EIT85804.1 dehydrogenase catalytic domain-containing protein [Fictibacillus macauensis ZFHKF-1]